MVNFPFFLNTIFAFVNPFRTLSEAIHAKRNIFASTLSEVVFLATNTDAQFPMNSSQVVVPGQLTPPPSLVTPSLCAFAWAVCMFAFWMFYFIFFLNVPFSQCFRSVSVADPESGAFLTPGSGMGKKSGSRIRIGNEQPGSYFRELRNHFFGVKILKFFYADPGWEKCGSRMEKIRIRDKHGGSATLRSVSALIRI
jgi:hypothetical protein